MEEPAAARGRFRSKRGRSLGKLLEHIYPVVFRSAGWLIGAAVLSAIAALATALAPLALKTIADHSAAVWAGWTPLGSRAIAPGALLFVALMAVSRLAMAAFLPFHATIELRVLRVVSDAVRRRVLALSPSFFGESENRGTVHAIDEGIRGLRTIIIAVAYVFVPTFVEVITIGYVISAIFDLRMTVAFALFVGAYGYAFSTSISRQKRAIESAVAIDREISSRLADDLLNIEAIAAFGAADRRADVLSGRLDERSRRWFRSYGERARNSVLLALIFVGFLVAIFILAELGLSKGRATTSDVVVLMIYSLQIAAPVERIAAMLREFAAASVHVKKLGELLSEPTEAERDRGTQVLSGDAPLALRIENLSFFHEPGRMILSNVTFEIEAGRTTAIVGPSGAGKSTLVKLLLRFLEPTQGRVIADGRPIDELSLASWRGAVGLVPQDTILLDDTIRANVAIAVDNVDEEAFAEAARISGLDEVVALLSEGWDTVVGERGTRLSGGERQRVALARALLRRARFVVFDEATSSLDTRTERSLQAGLAAMVRRPTMLVIAHRLTTVVEADEIIVLEGGRVVERGRHDGLLAQQGLYASLWAAQRSRTEDERCVAPRRLP